MVQDQRTISWTQMAILEMPQNGSLSTFSCNLYHEEFIFFTFHAKSGHRKIFKKIPILSTLPAHWFYYRSGEKIHVKKKATRNWLTFIKKAFHREFHIVTGHLSMFSLFWFWPQTRCGFFLTFFWIFSGFPIANLFSPIPRALLIRRDRFLFLCDGGTFLFPLIPNLAQLICSKSIKNPNIGKKIRKFAKIGKKFPLQIFQENNLARPVEDLLKLSKWLLNTSTYLVSGKQNIFR